MLKKAGEKVDEMQEQIGNFNRDENPFKSQMEKLFKKKKKTIPEMKDSLNRIQNHQ